MSSGPDHPVLHQAQPEHLPVPEHVAQLLVAHLRQRRVHHEDQPDGDRDRRRAHLRGLVERRDRRRPQVAQRRSPRPWPGRSTRSGTGPGTTSAAPRSAAPPSCAPALPSWSARDRLQPRPRPAPSAYRPSPGTPRTRPAARSPGSPPRPAPGRTRRRTNSTSTASPSISTTHVARPPVAVLGPAHRARVHEVDPVDRPVPGLVRVTERDHVARLRARAARHPGGRTVRAVLGPVDRVQHRVAVDQDQPRTGRCGRPAAGCRCGTGARPASASSPPTTCARVHA